MDATFIRTIIDATQSVFGTMLRSTVKFGTPGPSSETPSSGEVSGVIGFSGTVAGDAVLRMPMATARGVVESFCGEPFEPDTEDFADAIGEITDMICGNAKSHLDSTGVTISCPRVAVGGETQPPSPANAVRITIPCEAPQGPFAIEISIPGAERGGTPQAEAG